ncbi:MAG TPA: peptidoglycan bridge formation glycyltransferase FemA/FemB family protein, partial [Candidatus Woesebacteria bacterium]|nr:peptidoglycan bridge formation glycyltransferase FemA/FemB family protein [Candidatus Woesebacteria bacterium]
MTNFNFKIITSKGEWEKFVAVHNQANFLQSYNWAEFARRLHKNYFLIGIFAGSNQIGAALVIKEQARRGDYLALAGGPLLDWQDKNIGSIFAGLTDCLKKLARSEKANFVRVRPQQQDSPELRT